MRKLSVLDYLNETGLLETIAYCGRCDYIPNTIEGLLATLEDLELNYWSYAEEDKDEIKNPKETVLVEDFLHDKRYFELYETVVW